MPPATDLHATAAQSADLAHSSRHGSIPSPEASDGDGAQPPVPFWKRETRFEKFSIQDFLSLGYLYLLSLGIMTEVIYYKLIGINILYYAGIADVLLSPVIFVTRRLAILAVLIALLVAVALVDYFKRKQVERCAREPQPSGKPVPQHPRDFFIKMSAIMVFFMFIGGGTGAGVAQANRVASGDFECHDALEFVDGTVQNVRIVGQNSGFVFYAVPGQSSPIIAPIEGNIRRIFTATQKIPPQEPLQEPPQKTVGDESATSAEPEKSSSDNATAQ